VRLAVAVVAILAAFAAPGAARASALAAFHTPGWAAACFVPSPYERPLWQTGLVCWTPNDGFTISMGPRGRPEWRYEPENRGYRDPFAAMRLLRFGRHWAVRPYWHCVSRRTGLTCWNRAGRGWWIGRYRGFRTF
jgi:hypothetical protein